MRSVVVVGASLAGLTCARTLRAEGFDGAITLLDTDADAPYDRPPLSKGFLDGTVERSSLSLLGPGDDQLELDWRLGARAVALDCRARAVELEDGSSVVADGVVIATGAAPLCPPAWASAGAYVLRTVADARALRDVLGAGVKLVVVGSGFIGAEVATVAAGLGCDVTVVGRESAPLERALGPRLAGVLASRYGARGIRLRNRSAVSAMHAEDGRVHAVEVEGGDLLEADVVLVAIGAAPVVRWLEGSGLQVADGVVCGPGGAAGPEQVVAVGDCAAWSASTGAAARRHEHWTSARRRGEEGARRLLHGARPPEEPPQYVWSDQLGARLQMAGEPDADGSLWVLDAAAPSPLLDMESLGESFVVGVVRDAILVGVLSCDSPRLFGQWRRRVGGVLDGG